MSLVIVDFSTSIQNGSPWVLTMAMISYVFTLVFNIGITCLCLSEFIWSRRYGLCCLLSSCSSRIGIA